MIQYIFNVTTFQEWDWETAKCCISVYSKSFNDNFRVGWHTVKEKIMNLLQ